jgi:20S proteasome subunit beta 3
MAGKDCVAIACDLRLGLQALTVSNNFPKIFQYGDHVFLGLTGLATDVATVADLFRYKVNLYRLREERHIAPRTFANLVSSSLYERRFGPFFVSPVVAGLDPKTGQPFICGFDSIGCIDFAKDFIVSGTASDQLFGMCESLWEPDLVRAADDSGAPIPSTFLLGRWGLMQGKMILGLTGGCSCRARTNSSRPFRKHSSTLSTATPSPAGVPMSISSRRTRSPRGC